MIDAFEHLSNHRRAQLILQEVERLLSGKRGIRPRQPSLSLFPVTENALGKRSDFKKPNQSFRLRAAYRRYNLMRKHPQSLHGVQKNPVIKISVSAELLKLFQNLGERCAHEILSFHQ